MADERAKQIESTTSQERAMTNESTKRSEPMLLIYERIETERRHLETHPKQAIMPQRGHRHEVVSRFNGCVMRLRWLGLGAIGALQTLAYQRSVNVRRRGGTGQSQSGAAILRKAVADRAALRDDPARGHNSASAARLSSATNLRPGNSPGTEVDQRATFSESTKRRERANKIESTKNGQRAIHAESVKRAGTSKSDKTVERAKSDKSTKADERAKSRESTKAQERNRSAAEFRRTTERSL